MGETAIDSWRNTVGFFVYYVGGMLVDELQMALDKEAGGIRLQKSEVGIRIGKRESNDRKERVTFQRKRRPVIKNIENFYKKERKKCFSKWVSRLETGKRCKGRPERSTNHEKNRVKFNEQS